MPCPHCSVQSSEHSQRYLGVCQVCIPSWKVDSKPAVQFSGRENNQPWLQLLTLVVVSRAMPCCMLVWFLGLTIAQQKCVFCAQTMCRTQKSGCCRELLQAMASQAMQRLQHFNSQNISNTLWAFASLNHHPGPMLLKVLQRELVHKLRQFTPQGIENVLWAFATLGHHPGEHPPSHSHLQPHAEVLIAAVCRQFCFCG